MLIVLSLLLTALFTENNDYKIVFNSSEENVRWYLNDNRIQDNSSRTLAILYEDIRFINGYITVRVEKGGFKPIVWVISEQLRSDQVFNGELKPASALMNESGNKNTIWFLILTVLVGLIFLSFFLVKLKKSDDPVIPFDPGDSIGDYTIVKKIADGGLGSIFLVEDSDAKQYALKLMTKYIENQELVGRFFLEENIIKELNSYNSNAPIVRCLTTGKHNINGSLHPYLILEYINGMNLKKWISADNNYNDNITIIRQIIDALEVIHSKSIIHLDLTPENILIRDNKRLDIVLIDFGVAAIKQNWSSQVALNNSGIGKPEYMSPEQFDLKQSIDYRTDYYSLGIIIYEMFTGKLPFYHEDLNMISYSHQNEPLPALSVDIPSNIRKIILHLTEKDKEKRPETLSTIKQYLI